MIKVKIKNTKPTRLAYIEHTGDYGNVPYDEYYSKLFSWAKEKKAKPGFKPVGIFYDNPAKTSPEQCRCEIGIPIRAPLSSGAEVKVKELPAMEVATTKFAGPAEDYTKTYNEMGKWIESNGYEWSGPAYEIYGKKPKVKGGQTIMYSEIQVPIKKK